MRFIVHGAIALVLTVLTQLGGVAWLASRLFRYKIPAFVVIYAGLSMGAFFLAPTFGRVALPCVGDGPLVVRSWIYCAANRQYVSDELRQVAQDAATRVAREYPDTLTLALDGNFPFFNGFPLLPHLSHDDGEKLDLALYYARDGQYLRGATRSPVGYFAFQQGPTDCPPRTLTLRWDLAWVQGLWPDYDLEPLRMRAMLRALDGDTRVGKVFLEPHLVQSLGVASPKLRFQGCNAARHDDHIHLQL